MSPNLLFAAAATGIEYRSVAELVEATLYSPASTVAELAEAAVYARWIKIGY